MKAPLRHSWIITLFMIHLISHAQYTWSSFVYSFIIINIWFRFVVLRPWCNNWDFSADTHFTLPWLTSPRAFPFEMFIWILLPAPYLYAHIPICISFNVPFCNFATYQFSIYFEYTQLPKSAIFGLRKVFGNMWEWMFSCAHLHFQLPPLPTPPIPLVGMKPLAQQHFFCWTQIHFNKIQRSLQIRFNFCRAYHSISAHVAITSPTPTVLSPFLLCQQTHKTQLNIDVAISQIWPFCFFLPPLPKMSPNLCYLHYNAK